MKYEHRFRVQASPQVVAEFHSRSRNMPAITPPPIVVQIHQGPEVIGEDDWLDFTMWLGLLPVRWLARHRDITPTGFIDYQVRGPMRTWRHRHTFVPLEDGSTEVVDQVEVELRRHPLWGPVGLGMWLGLPFLFAYRGWRTRSLLEPKPSATSPLPVPFAPANPGPVALLLAGLLLVGYGLWRRSKRQSGHELR